MQSLFSVSFLCTHLQWYSSFKHCSFLVWHIHFSTWKALSSFLEWGDSKGYLESLLICTPKQSVLHEALHGPALFHFALPSPSGVGIPFRLVVGLVFHCEKVSLWVFLNFLKSSITSAYCLINLKLTSLRQVTQVPDMEHFPQMHLHFCKEIVVCLLNFFCSFFHLLWLPMFMFSAILKCSLESLQYSFPSCCAALALLL